MCIRDRRRTTRVRWRTASSHESSWPAAMPPEEQPGGVVAAPASAGGFQVHLDNFTGPFDLLLSLISRHRLDITEVALAQVTDEFIAAARQAEDSDSPWGLGHLSEFLVVAATLLDLKAARLLPATDVDDAEDLEMLEARDPVSYTHLRAHETVLDLVCRLLLEKK